MLEEIMKMLLGGIDAEKILGDAASRFYETVEEQKKEHLVLEELLDACATMEAYYQTASDPQRLDLMERDAVMGMQDDMEYDLQEAFDRVEDDVKHELLHGKPAARVREELKSAGILMAQRRQTEMPEDTVEEFYLEAFQRFDQLREHLMQIILDESPRNFYRQGEEKIQAYRQANGLLMDAKEFNDYYRDHLDQQRLMRLLSQKVYETIHFGQRYILEEAEEDAEDPAEDGYREENGEEEYEASQKDAVLVPAGDLDPEQFTFIYELMTEYTGRRVLASENEYGGEAYWTTYGDDFAELLGLFMIAQLENTIRYFCTEKAEEYDTFARMYHWSQEQRQNPETVLTCDKISYYLSDLQEKLWNEFTESKLMPIYEEGRQLAKKQEK